MTPREKLRQQNVYLEQCADYVCLTHRDEWVFQVKGEALGCSDPVEESNLYRKAYIAVYGHEAYEKHHRDTLIHWTHFYEDEGVVKQEEEVSELSG